MSALNTKEVTGCRNAATAWVNFDGTGTVAIRDDYNVDSITDNGTGNYTVNFTSAMADANYGATALLGTGASSSLGLTVRGPEDSDPTVNSFQFITLSEDQSANNDPKFTQVSFFGGES